MEEKKKKHVCSLKKNLKQLLLAHVSWIGKRNGGEWPRLSRTRSTGGSGRPTQLKAHCLNFFIISLVQRLLKCVSPTHFDMKGENNRTGNHLITFHT